MTQTQATLFLSGLAVAALVVALVFTIAALNRLSARVALLEASSAGEDEAAERTCPGVPAGRHDPSGQ